MIRKLLKSGLAIIMAMSMVIGMTVATSAQSDANNPEGAVYEDAKITAEKAAEAIISEYGATSLQYALIDDGRIVISGQAGVYSKETKAPPTNVNMYGIGSVSKTFTAAAVMQLVEKGKVNLDSPVIKYIPEFKMKDPRYKKITVRMLLNHSSGLMGSTVANNNLFSGKYSSPYSDLLKALKNATLKADPGKFSSYCNDGYTLAELLVQKVSGLSFSDYIKKYVSDPLGLENTKTPADKFDTEKLVKTYIEGTDILVPHENKTTIGEGGMYSSAEDLCKFAQVFMEGSDSKVLSKASVKAMANPEYKNGLWPKEEYSMESFGLGWDCVDIGYFEQYGIEALFKGGSTQFYKSALIVLPGESMAMAVSSSGGAGVFNELMAKNVLLSVLKSKGIINEIKDDKTFKSPVAVKMPDTLKKYEGIYVNNSTLFKVAIDVSGKLSFTENPDVNEKVETYTYAGDNKFYSEDGSSYFSFVESSGNTYLYYSSYSTVAPFGQVLESGYLAQKAGKNPMASDVKTAWKKRDGKKYFVCSEKYNSQAYVFYSQISITLSKTMEGYCNLGCITGKNTAKSLVQIPGSMGRDLNELNFSYQGKTEYLDVNGTKLISEDSMGVLPASAKFSVKIGDNGFAQWYKISGKSANQTISIAVPANSSFAVYDGNGNMIDYSCITNSSSVKLPENGYIVFIGDKGSKFDAKYPD